MADAIIAAALALPGVAAHAETAPEKGVIAVRYLNYKDSQPGLDRIHVTSPSVYVTAPISPRWAVSGSLESDSVSGATPRYHTAISGATPRMSDKRLAGHVQVKHYQPRSSYSVDLAGSDENDYTSVAGSLTANFASADNNRSWDVGVAYASDKIGSTVNPALREQKRTTELMFGVIQAMTADDLLQVNLTLISGRGYFSDPYKEVDNRPSKRDQAIALLRWNHYVSAVGAVLRPTYRFYRDSYGINAHTLSAEWAQPLGKFTITPLVRLYSQNAASFYFDPVYDTNLGAPYPPGFFAEPPAHSSADQRLSAFGAVSLGLGMAYAVSPALLVDLKFERYEQRSDWQVGGKGSPGLDPFSATFVQFGVESSF